jgi:hypothetical protein
VPASSEDVTNNQYFSYNSLVPEARTGYTDYIVTAKILETAEVLEPAVHRHAEVDLPPRKQNPCPADALNLQPGDYMGTQRPGSSTERETGALFIPYLLGEDKLPDDSKPKGSDCDDAGRSAVAAACSRAFRAEPAAAPARCLPRSTCPPLNGWPVTSSKAGGCRVNVISSPSSISQSLTADSAGANNTPIDFCSYFKPHPDWERLRGLEVEGDLERLSSPCPPPRPRG